VKITRVEALRIEIPLPDPGLRPAWGPGLVQRAWSDVLVKVHTDEGLTGCAAGHSFVSHLEQRIAPYMVGKDPFALEYHHQVLQNAGGAFFVDIALWDIIGKACGQPLYRLFGGDRTKIKAYAATCEVGTPERRAEDALRYLEEGFTAMKLRLHDWTLREDVALVEAVRKAVGDRMEIMVDANQTFSIPSPGPWPKWTYQRAVETARALEELGVVWLEEPLWRHRYADLGRLAAEVDIPIAGGEFNMGLHEYRAILEHGAYDILQADPAYLGITQTRKILAMAEAWDKPYAPHNGYNGIGVSACLHLALAHPQALYLEYLHDPPVALFSLFSALVTEPLRIDREGYVHAPDTPGLGVELNEEIVRRYGQGG
jgi:L-alanine-DL-glutamate epimerase-like enolase superfamily enzyme